MPACGACGSTNPGGKKFCGDCGAVLVATTDEPRPLDTSVSQAKTGAATKAEGERRQLTILFCDLVGSTSLSQRLDAEEWHELITHYQQVASTAVGHWGGYVAKNLGDGLLIYFGWPSAHEDDPERAVRGGLAILDAMASLNATLAQCGRTPLELRIGVHTGTVVIAGGGEVFGETANVAARVQTAAEPDTVVVSAATQRLVAGLFLVEERSGVLLKGIREPMDLYRVVRPSGVRGRLEVSAGRHTPFIGRRSEFSVLADAWERVVKGSGQTVLVQGEAGVGKSRLCHHLRERLSAGPLTWLESHCSPYTASTAFRPVIEWVEQALALQPTAPPAEKLERLRLAFPVGQSLRLLAEWLDLPESAGYRAIDESSDLKRRKTLETLAAWHLDLGNRQPTVLLVEDLHWCDPSSLELLARLVAQNSTARLLLIGTARPEFTSPWPVRSNLQTVILGRLTGRQTREMIATVSASRSLPEPLVEQLVARADGIPLFAEELTRAVVEAGVDAAAAIPATLQDSLMARLDRLHGAKEVAQRAAVLGREFSYALLAAASGLDPEALHDGLARLVEAGLMFERGFPPDRTYTFKHALVQEAAYESLLKRARQHLHGRAVDALVQDFPERAAAEPEAVAQHAEAAGRIDEALDYFQRAGGQAQSRSAHGEAIAHFRKALAMLALLPESSDRDGREVALQLALAPSLAAARGYAHRETEAAYERARDLANTGQPRDLSSALVGLANAYLNSGRFEQALRLIDQAIALAATAPSDWQAVAAYREKVIIDYFQGRFRSTLEHGERLMKYYQPSLHHRPIVSLIGDDAAVVARCFSGWAFWHLGYADRARASVHAGISAAGALDHPFSVALARFFATAVHWMRREIDTQRRAAEELMEFAEAQGFPFWLGLAKIFHGHALGDSVRVEAAVAETAATGSQAAAPMLFAVLAQTFQARSRYDEALGALEAGFGIAARTVQPFFDAELHRLRGEVLLASGRAPAEIEPHFRRALEIARAQEARTLELRAATSLARLWGDEGKRAAAREMLAPVYTWFSEGFDTEDLLQAKGILDGLE